MLNESCMSFFAGLASAQPVPGGGGASAFTGALGVALASMVANLTKGKKKYEAYEGDIRDLLETSETLWRELADLVLRDAQAFAPLSEAYRLPKETEDQRLHRATVMEEALLHASLVPLEIMEQAYRGLRLHEELAEKGNRLALSDVGVGIQLLKAAILGASMNIFINTKSMADRRAADEIEKKADRLIAEATTLADAIYRKAEEAIRG